MSIGTLLLVFSTIAASAQPPDVLVADVVKCLCKTSGNRDRCATQRRLDVPTKLVAMAEVVRDHTPVLPGYMRLPFLAAMACGESGLRSAPTCGANQSCYSECVARLLKEERIGKHRSRCIQMCGGRKRCNDRGNSEGFFQLGRIHQAAMTRLYGTRTAAFDIRLSSHYVLGYLKRAVSGVVGDCKRYGASAWARPRLWAVVGYRFGRGPTLHPSRKAGHRCEKNLYTGKELCRDFPAESRVPNCLPNSRYVRLARYWYRKNAGAWSWLPVEVVR